MVQRGLYRTIDWKLLTIYGERTDPNTGMNVWYGSRPMGRIMYYLPDGKVCGPSDMENPNDSLRLDTFTPIDGGLPPTRGG